MKLARKAECRICSKMKKWSKFDHGKEACLAIADVCHKCCIRLRKATDKERALVEVN